MDASDQVSIDDDLPIDGFDHLSASQVLQVLDGLSGDELDRVGAYEALHRRRRTVLAGIEAHRRERLDRSAV